MYHVKYVMCGPYNLRRNRKINGQDTTYRKTLEIYIASTPTSVPKTPQYRKPFYSRDSVCLSADMKHVAAYLLAVLGGNANPSADDLKNILSSVGIEADEDRLELLLSQVSGKDITELIASGREKLASVPAGGGGAVAVAAAPGGAPAAAAAAEPAKKEEKVEEESSDEDMGISLFDD